MNYETIRSYLNTPIEEIFQDKDAIEEAKNTLKKFESFDKLLKDRLETFDECERICLLELLNNLQLTKEATRDFILGFKFGIRALKRYYETYNNAREYLIKKGV